MTRVRWPYWARLTALATVSLSLLFLFTIGFLPQRIVLELDFAESGFAYPAIRPPLPEPPPAASAYPMSRPIPRGPAERFWAEYLQLVQVGDEAGALGLLREYITRYPDDLGATLEYGRALWRAEHHAGAIKAYEFVSSNDRSPVLALELARLYVSARRWDDALKLYADLAADRPDDVQLLSEYAEAATWAERYELADRLYGRLTALEPGEPMHRLWWARVLYWSGQPGRAANALEGLPEDFMSASVDSLRLAVATALPPPEVPINLLVEARGQAMAGAVDSALALYRLHLEAEPQADTVLLEIADVFEYRAGEADSAMAYLRKYLTRQPDAQTVRLRLARLLTWSGRLQAAEATADSIVAAEPENAEAWVLLGDLRRWRGDAEAADAAYRTALAIDPEAAGAEEGLAELKTQSDAALAREGTIGPSGRVDYFADNDNYSDARWRGGALFGKPDRRLGFEAAVERVAGFDISGGDSDLTAFEARVVGERWWQDGGLHASASLGAWMPSSKSIEPLVMLSMSAPNWGGSAYRLEYRHEPAYRQTNTFEAAEVNMRADLFGLEFYRPLFDRWQLSASGRVARFAGVDDENLRGDASLTFLYRPGGGWLMGYESRALAFRDPAPVAWRPIYWSPEWYWLHSAVGSWTGELGRGWRLAAQGLVGVAWMDERVSGVESAVQFGVLMDLEYNVGLWTVVGRTAVSQARADGYRMFRFELAGTRKFGS
jgi:Flp pilus assembly protein TadD